MTKLLPSLALVLLASAGAAAPALAADFGSFDPDFQLTRLHDQGINAVDVAEDSADVLRATVKLADGGTTFEYYDIATLNPIRTSQSGSEVTGSIGKAPVQHSAPAMSLNSLTHDAWE